jgi:hypothetical protein
MHAAYIRREKYLKKCNNYLLSHVRCRKQTEHVILLFHALNVSIEVQVIKFYKMHTIHVARL